MNDKINKGYIITDSVHVGDTEFVLGVSMHESNQFVTWECKDGKEYYWGHYTDNSLKATVMFTETIEMYITYLLLSNTVITWQL